MRRVYFWKMSRFLDCVTDKLISSMTTGRWEVGKNKLGFRSVAFQPSMTQYLETHTGCWPLGLGLKKASGLQFHISHSIFQTIQKNVWNQTGFFFFQMRIFLIMGFTNPTFLFSFTHHCIFHASHSDGRVLSPSFILYVCSSFCLKSPSSPSSMKIQLTFQYLAYLQVPFTKPLPIP